MRWVSKDYQNPLGLVCRAPLAVKIENVCIRFTTDFQLWYDRFGNGVARKILKTFYRLVPVLKIGNKSGIMENGEPKGFPLRDFVQFNREIWEKKMTRCIGIDLHTDSFTACILQEGESERMQTLRLQNGGLESFLATLRPDDELAVEASGNTRVVA